MRLVMNRSWLILCLCLLPMIARQLDGAPIHFEKGRRYDLHQKNGPWMIMVASFQPASLDGQVRDGKTPQQLADELVWELRSLRPNPIPAYSYSIKAADERVETTDRLGREEERKFLTRKNQVCVMAGNYQSLEKGQATLNWIKKFNPKCLQQQGVKYLKTNRRQGPLGGAFLTMNPLLSPEEVQQRRHDPLLVKLNSGGKYSLYENDGEYSLVVATFSGKKLAHIGDSNSLEAQQAFRLRADGSEGGSDGIGKFWNKTEENDLDAASRSAWELAVTLRERENVDAYVWHDRYQSVVTVGSFDSPNDPRLKRYLQVFAPSPVTQASVSTDPVVFPGAPSNRWGIAAGGSGTKILAADGFGKNGDQDRLWAFDPNPMLMRVPRTR
jgi:hypothetical protein